jgi:hypothetical protein
MPTRAGLRFGWCSFWQPLQLPAAAKRWQGSLVSEFVLVFGSSMMNARREELLEKVGFARDVNVCCVESKALEIFLPVVRFA